MEEVEDGFQHIATAIASGGASSQQPLFAHQRRLKILPTVEVSAYCASVLSKWSLSSICDRTRTKLISFGQRRKSRYWQATASAWKMSKRRASTRAVGGSMCSLRDGTVVLESASEPLVEVHVYPVAGRDVAFMVVVVVVVVVLVLVLVVVVVVVA